MDGKAKLEELVTDVDSWPEWQVTHVSADTIRSVSDAFKAMERERDTLRALIALAHPVMRACGWHLAIASAPQGDGVLEAACTEVEDKFAEALKDPRHE